MKKCKIVYEDKNVPFVLRGYIVKEEEFLYHFVSEKVDYKLILKDNKYFYSSIYDNKTYEVEPLIIGKRVVIKLVYEVE